MSIEVDSTVVREARSVKALPPREFLLECFAYDEETGVLRWKSRPREHFKTKRSFTWWNRRYAGAEAGTHNTSGALGVGVGEWGVCLVHRLIMVMMGVPLTEEDEVDHRNRKRDDNSWKNLRVCTSPQNSWNMTGVRTVNHQLPRGVFPNGRNFKATMVHNGRFHYLGTYATPEEARVAYVTAEVKLRGEFAFGHSQQEG